MHSLLLNAVVSQVGVQWMGLLACGGLTVKTHYIALEPVCHLATHLPLGQSPTKAGWQRHLANQWESNTYNRRCSYSQPLHRMFAGTESFTLHLTTYKDLIHRGYWGQGVWYALTRRKMLKVLCVSLCCEMTAQWRVIKNFAAASSSPRLTAHYVPYQSFFGDWGRKGKW